MTSAALNPLENATDWDTVQIGLKTSPGICTISGAERKFGWDIKKGKGTLGGTLTFNESPPVEFSIEFELWEPSHFVEWDTFRTLFKYDPTKKSTTAIDIYHPSLADLDIKSVVCKSLGAIEHKGKQLYSVKVDLIEYHPPPKKSAVSTPDTSKPNANTPGIGKQPDPIADAQQAEIQKLLTEINKP